MIVLPNEPLSEAALSTHMKDILRPVTDLRAVVWKRMNSHVAASYFAARDEIVEKLLLDRSIELLSSQRHRLAPPRVASDDDPGFLRTHTLESVKSDDDGYRSLQLLGMLSVWSDDVPRLVSPHPWTGIDQLERPPKAVADRSGHLLLQQYAFLTDTEACGGAGLTGDQAQQRLGATWDVSAATIKRVLTRARAVEKAAV